MRDHAVVSRRRISTTNYPQAARQRLGDAVAHARAAAGYKFRTDFGRAHGINTKSLELLELGKPGVGQAILYAVGRALSGWTEDTPIQILDGAPVPEAARPEPAPEPVDLRAVAVYDLASILAAGSPALEYQAALGRWRTRLGDTADMWAVAKEAQDLAGDAARLAEVQAQLTGQPNTRSAAPDTPR